MTAFLQSLNLECQQVTRTVRQAKLAWAGEGILDIFRPKIEEDRHNFAGIEIQAKLFESNLYIVQIYHAAY